jgi:hypothetical protein
MRETSFMSRGVIGLCSCGWLGGEESSDTRRAANAFREAWETHLRTQRPTGAISKSSAPVAASAPRGESFSVQ